jgi:phosphoacetylglucosamine mutase
MSSPGLASAVINGLKCLDVEYKDFGEVTTPQLHYLVANHSKNPQQSDYVEHFSNAFSNFCQLSGPAKPGYEPNFILDCANGVGALTFPQVLSKIKHIIQP